MRIDMIYFPTDLFSAPPDDVDVEASGRTFVAQLSSALTHVFPGARLNVWYNPIAVHSEEEFEIHWEDGEVTPQERADREREIRKLVAQVAGELRASHDWIVHDFSRVH
jgi:hypothetical protein